MRHKYIECACSSDGHTLRFTWDPDPECPEIYVSTFLEAAGFWKRLWSGIKYIFGYKCAYGHFSETVLMHDQLKELRDLCDNFLSVHVRKPTSSEDAVDVARLIVAMRERALEQARVKLAEAQKNLESGEEK